MRRLRPAVLLAAAALAAMGQGCGREPDEEAAGERAGAGFADLRVVAAAHVTAHEDLPGVAGFADLDEAARKVALERANRAECDCGCVGHTVAGCLHQQEPCDVAVRLATAFVDDARAARWAIGPDDAAATSSSSGATSPPSGAVPPPTVEDPSSPSEPAPAPSQTPPPAAPTTEPQPGETP